MFRRLASSEVWLLTPALSSRSKIAAGPGNIAEHAELAAVGPTASPIFPCRHPRDTTVIELRRRRGLQKKMQPWIASEEQRTEELAALRAENPVLDSAREEEQGAWKP
eukprot:761960-Hanusia_phi.AAC.2